MQSQATGGVSLRGITKRYGRQAAVDDLWLDVEPGEFLTLLGPSGCGKTTSLRIIAGLEQPNAGFVFINGGDVTEDPANIRPVNTVFQSYALFPHLSVFENVAFGLRRRRLDSAEIERRVRQQIDMMALQGHEHRRPYQLSGGEQQRVALARALVLKPAVLLLDEPFASLDFKLRQRLQIELKSLQRETGISFIMVTHDQNEALAMSDRVAVMNKGILHQLGNPIEVYQRPATPFVASFLGDANLFDAQAVEASPEIVTAALPDGSRVHGSAVVTDSEAGTHVKVFVRPEDVTVTDKCGACGESRNSVRGSVEATVIIGGLDRKVLVRLADGTTVESLIRAGAPDLPTGTRVWATWPVEKTLIYGRES